MDVADPSPKMNVTFPFVVTTIDVESDPSKDASAIIARYGPDARAIKFSGEIKADFQDNDAALLLQVEQIPPSQTSEKVHVFIGVKVSKETFMAELKKTGQSFFAYVHGFTAEPDKSFKTCEIIQSYEKKKGKTTEVFPRTVIPVIWPSVGDVGAGGVVFKNKYDEEQKITKAAGAALATLSELGADSDVNIALMCHSMGNRFLFSFASQQNINPGKKFDQIFMVAADVWEEVFNKGAIEKTYRHNEWEDAGLKVVRMLKEGGKVHCIHYKHDLALKGSVAENWRTRLGSYGIQSQNKRGKVHHECKPFIVDFDMDDNLERESDARGAVSKHCYQATASVIEYYMQHL